MMDGWTNDGCTSITRVKLNNSEPETVTFQQMFAGKIGVDIKVALKIALICLLKPTNQGIIPVGFLAHMFGLFLF